RSQDPEAFARAVVGREIVGTSRRAKLVVLELDNGAAITIHLKMTGQLFVVRAGALEDPYIRLVLEVADGRGLWFRAIRQFGRGRRGGAKGGDRRPRGGARGWQGVQGLRAGAARSVLHGEGLSAANPWPQGPAQAAVARPVIRRWRRQHLRRRGAVGVAPPST